MKDGIRILYFVHSLQNILPHILQWCLRFIMLKVVLHSKHMLTLSSGVHMDGVMGMGLDLFFIYQ